MKHIILKAALALAAMTSLSAYAQSLTNRSRMPSGGVATGGGDLCEDRIQTIRNDIKKWILNGHAVRLQFPAGLKLQEYSRRMLEQISIAQIRCVGNGDAGYPVQVQGLPKVCRFDRSSSSSMITCDAEKFEKMSEEQQYALVHHEFAGLAEIERPDGARSDYQVSKQLTSQLEDQVVKRLAMKPVASAFEKIPQNMIVKYRNAVAAAAYKYMCGVDHIPHMGSGFVTASMTARRADEGEFNAKESTIILYADLLSSSGVPVSSARLAIIAQMEGAALKSLKLGVEFYRQVNVGNIMSIKTEEKWVREELPNTPECKRWN